MTPHLIQLLSNEEAELVHDVARRVFDAKNLISELYKLRLSPDHADYFAAEEGSLWSMHVILSELINDLRATDKRVA